MNFNSTAGSVERLVVADDSIDFGSHMHSALSAAESKRCEKNEKGYVHFRREEYVPEMGGVSLKTRTGHMLKNQSYYCRPPGTNTWDLPIHAGTNTWKEWHGPKMRTDAPMMERLDRFNEEEDQWDAKKKFVNTTRAQTLDRFYNRKLTRDQLEAAHSWAPHRRAKREVHGSHEHFYADLDSKPEKELKKVLTPFVLQKDQEAGHMIAAKIQNEETFKMAWKHWEEERRHHIRLDFQHRQHYNDVLMHAAGQPVKQRTEELSSLNNCSTRTDQLSVPREAAQIGDVTRHTDFRGLFHADNEHALEALFPGQGHEQSVEWREQATASSRGGWPPPDKQKAQYNVPKGKSREKAMLKTATLTQEHVPIADARANNVVARQNDEMLKTYSKAQFLSHEAPPPPDQRKMLMVEHWSTSITNAPCDTKKNTGKFARTTPGSPSHSPKVSKNKSTASVSELPTGSMEHLPPPHRPFTYPVLAPASPNARGAQLSVDPSEASPTASPGTGMRRINSTPGSLATAKRNRSLGSGQETKSMALCKELDSFESVLEPMPRVSNFFNTPRGQSKGLARESRSETRLGSKSISQQGAAARDA